MSKFEINRFIGGYDDIAVSKEKFTKDEAIKIAMLETEGVKKPYYLAIGDCFVRHRAGMNEDNEPCVGWWIEYVEHKRSCPCWGFHVLPVNADLHTIIEKKYEHILVE